jgi:hypothetical protein
MAAVKPIKREKPYRAGQSDPFSLAELQSLYALVMTLHDLQGGYVETRDADHEYWLPYGLAAAIEERCARLVKAEKEREDREYRKPKDGA